MLLDSADMLNKIHISHLWYLRQIWGIEWNGCLERLPSTDPQRWAAGGLVPRLPCSKLQHNLQEVKTWSQNHFLKEIVRWNFHLVEQRSPNRLSECCLKSVQTGFPRSFGRSTQTTRQLWTSTDGLHFGIWNQQLTKTKKLELEVSRQPLFCWEEN